MFGKLTMGKKLFGSIGAALIVALLMGILTFVSLARVGAATERVANGDTDRRLMANQIYIRVTEMISLDRAIQNRAFMKDQAGVDKYHEDFRAELDKLHGNVAKLSMLAVTPETKAFVQEVTTSSSRLADLDDQVYQKAKANDLGASSAVLVNDFLPLANQLQTDANTIIALQTKLIAADLESVNSIHAQAVGITIFMLLLAVVIGVIVVRIVLGINSALLATAAALGDGAEQIASAASQVSSSSQSLAQGATEQAAAVEETSASAEQINSMARRSTDSSRDTAKLVTESQRRVELANQNLEDMVVAMNDLAESSSKISKIIKVIDEIAFQTNILALNAAVEAARAGEAGMGFAVVAEEVRSLAQRSAQAAKDTAVLIEDSIAKTTSSKTKVDQVAVTMHAITEESGRIKILIDGVSQGSEEQSRGIEQIGKAINQIEKVTQNAAANSEQTAAAAEQLSAQSEAMREVIGQLRTMVSGEEGNMPARAFATPSRVMPREQLRAIPAKPRAAAAPTFKSALKPKPSFSLSHKPAPKDDFKDDFMEADFQEF